ncbi:Adaptor complexes medium subunit family-domain-containing protein [Pyronema domesticum]|uniref:Similar to AP-3 complex subunit mu-1 acc. no. P53676 n=1 Tax=Pyronema omphalodes (strain CBS 100304) TaxID=1076935 RepID=U4LPU0_PYROM|nr:Adaptor complexes medium subunit family-domain-containing protein [Pyronema domesticum]CCX33970.1 Similar to AP-3 complex subunit mu-1; acc. no. P53676 [Pyronema omphalodes CBS 100304]
MSAIDALYIFDRFAPTATIILQHEWRSRPSTSPASLLTHYNALPSPRPSLIYIPTTSPPTLLFNLEHSNLLLLSPATSEIEPLLVLEFLHRVVDVLEDYLGSPLVASKIESNYDIVAQLLNEMADDGFPFITEPNALRDVVLPPSLIGKLFSSVTGLPNNTLQSLTPSNTISPIPWRRANVKHTNNELYVDVIELVTATIAPSGRPLSARSNGTIAFNSKLSGVPDLLLTLQAPNSHKQTLGATPNSIISYPVFHPCVRLSRWRDRPGELSFVPPDGKFILASYEVDLLPKKDTNLTLPVTVEMKTAVGHEGDEFEVRVFISTASLVSSGGNGSGNSPAFGSRGGSTRSPAFGSSSNALQVEEVSVTIPLPPQVKTLVATRCSRGEYHHEGREVVWKIPMTGGTATSSTATFRTAIQIRGEEEAEEGEDDAPRKKRMAMAMPRCAIIGFSVKGWLASGIKVDSLKIVGGRGIGEGVKPYKGVKYITRAGGVEVRC